MGLALIMTAINVFAWSHSTTAGAGVTTATVGIFASIKKSDGTEFGEAEKEMLKGVETLISKTVSQPLSKEELTELVNTAIKAHQETTGSALNLEQLEELRKTVKEHAEIFASESEKSRGKNEDKQTLKGIIAEQFKSETLLSQIKGIAESKKGMVSLTLKTATVINSNSMTDLPQQQYEPGLSQAPRRTNRIMSFCNVAPAASSLISWMNKKNAEGNAAMTAEGVLKTLRDWELDRTESKAKKVAVVEKCVEELIEDVPGMQAFIEQDIMQAIEDQENEQIITGDGTGENMTGIDTLATAYSLTTISTTNPTNKDAISAAIAQVLSLNHVPTHVFVNPIDYANIKNKKGSDGHYMYKGADGIEVSLILVQTNDIAQGSFLVGDMMKVNIRPMSEVRIQIGWENDDFRKNQITIIGERRVHMFVKDADVTAFVYDTYANVIAAL